VIFVDLYNLVGTQMILLRKGAAWCSELDV